MSLEMIFTEKTFTKSATPSKRQGLFPYVIDRKLEIPLLSQCKREKSDIPALGKLVQIGKHETEKNPRAFTGQASDCLEPTAG
jgi:hypothetical protein